MPTKTAKTSKPETSAVSKPTRIGARPPRNPATVLAGLHEMRGNAPVGLSTRDRSMLAYLYHRTGGKPVTVANLCKIGPNPLAPKMRGNTQISWPDGSPRFSDTDDIDVINRNRHLDMLTFDAKAETVSFTKAGAAQARGAVAGQFAKSLAALPEFEPIK